MPAGGRTTKIRWQDIVASQKSTLSMALHLFQNSDGSWATRIIVGRVAAFCLVAATTLAVAGALIISAIGGCGRSIETDPATGYPLLLSHYGLFTDAQSQLPAEGVIPYDVNSALFSDYTLKHRFVKLPAGAAATYHPDRVFELPVGTIIAKTFSLPADMSGTIRRERHLETRILMHQPEGWIGLPYVWDDDQKEARLQLAGGTLPVQWRHHDGSTRTNDYLVPNTNQCKTCHKIDNQMLPIGLAARHLNRDYTYVGGRMNQIDWWSKKGLLQGAPSAQQAPRLPVWDDPAAGSVAKRSRAWLEINCAHCHQPGGSARNSGLDLMASQSDPLRIGVGKPPVAAGRGSGGLKYDIVPGRPDESILVFRISSIHPDIMMPELGKRLVHDEGVALIRQWVSEMQPVDLSAPPAFGAGNSTTYISDGE